MKSFTEFLMEALVIKKSPIHSKELFHKISDASRTGYQRLGGGVFGVAVRKKNPESSSADHVFKIAQTDLENPHEDPYMRHAVHSMNNHTTNDHLPKIEKIHSIKTPTGAVHVVKMEKLHSMSYADENELKSMHHHAFGSHFNDNPVNAYSRINSNVFTNKINKHVSAHQSATLSGKTYNDPEFLKFPNHMKKTIAHLARTPLKMNDKHSGNEVGPDLHTGNIMMRSHPDGTHHLVVTDPFVSYKDLGSVNRGGHGIHYKKEYRSYKKTGMKDE